jgi:hypothetical protein
MSKKHRKQVTEDIQQYSKDVNVKITLNNRSKDLSNSFLFETEEAYFLVRI